MVRRTLALAAVAALTGVGGLVPAVAGTAVTAGDPARAEHRTGHQRHGLYAGQDAQGHPVHLYLFPQHVHEFMAGSHHLGSAEVDHGTFRVCHPAGCYAGGLADPRTIAGRWWLHGHASHHFVLHAERDEG